MSDEQLRKQVKLLKATEAISNYYEIAEILEMTSTAFYNWLNRQYNLGSGKKRLLKSVIDDLVIPN